MFFASQAISKNYGEINFSDNPIPKVQKQPTIKDGCLRGNVSVIQDLPEEFFGTWSIVSRLIDTTHPETFRMKSSDIWTFQRQDNVITLSNPVSGATASITINEVRGQTAVFSRKQEEKDEIETEIVEITVEGDKFSGTDLIVMEYLRNGIKTNTIRVKYKVTGYKISGPTLKNIFAR